MKISIILILGLTFIFTKAQIRRTSFLTYNYVGYFISRKTSNDRAVIDNTAVEKFNIVEAINGCSDGGISIRTITDTISDAKFLVKDGNKMSFLSSDGTEDFKRRATFKIHRNKYFPGYAAFEGIGSDANKYIRHQNFKLKLQFLKENPNDLYERDTSFLLTDDGYSYSTFQAENYPLRYWSVSASQGSQFEIKDSPISQFHILSPGLTGELNTVSFFHPSSGKHLRHRNFVIYLEDIQRQIGNPWDLFHKDVTFIMRRNKFFPGFTAFESVNYPGKFIRHFNFKLYLQSESSTDSLFKRDTSFKITTYIE